MEQLFQELLDGLSPLLQAFIQGAAAVLMAQAIAYAQKAIAMKTANLSEQQRYIFEAVARSAVTATEQIYSTQFGAGVDKREKAFNLIEAELARIGLKIDASAIFAEIESQVYQAAFQHEGEQG